ncbi:MAG: hypothetical protein ABI837_05580 [Acidobacteriota bacterium]
MFVKRLRPPFLAAALCATLVAAPAFAAPLTINNQTPIFSETSPVMIIGTAEPNVQVHVRVEGSGEGETTSDKTGAWSLLWSAPLRTGTYNVTATAGSETAAQLLRIQVPGLVQRQSSIELPPPRYGNPEIPHPESYQEMTDRWRIAPPPFELDENPRGRKIGDRGATLDPYNRNLLKGDIPIFGKDWFFVLTGVSDTLAESRTLPTPSGVSAVEPTSIGVFGKDAQNVFNENLQLSFDLFQGLTTFKPISQRVKVTLIENINWVHVRENGLVKPDVRRGTKRTDGQFAIQEFFYEKKLKDLTTNYDIVSIRVGSQPFASDFRGFIFNDTNTGVRLFGNYAANRYQYNLAVFDRLEKDTNSGLNTFERRGQQVAIANFYWQDFLVHGYTQQFSIHFLKDDATLRYDRNGNLVRPAPVGVFVPHAIRATYFGEAGLGHIGRFNVDHAVYYVIGKDDLNPIAGPDPRLRADNGVKIRAGSAALEVSYDHDWFRPRLAMFYASGDRNPRDRRATGFDAIFESPAFAGGGFSFFNRLGIRLAGTGVSLTERGSLLPDLRSSKDEGQPNYVNPGVQLLSAGVDIDVTPKLKTILTANYIRFDSTKTLEQLLFQGNISRELGTDLSIGLRYRPFLNQNFVVIGGVAGWIPGQGFKDIYERDKMLYQVFTNVILTF